MLLIIRRLVILIVVLLGASLLCSIIIPKGAHCIPITISKILLGVGIGMLFGVDSARRDWRKSKVLLDKIPNNLR